MKKVLISILVLLFIAIGLAYGYGSTLSDKWHVEESLVIETAPKHVHHFVADLTTWNQWTAWNKERDPSGEWTYEGAPNTVGYSMMWEGPELGKGKLVITEITPDKGIRYDLFFNDSPENSLGRIALEPEGEGTKVTWTDDLKMESPFMRIAGPTFQEMVGKDFAKGLEGLRERALVHAANFPDPPAEVALEGGEGDAAQKEGENAAPASALENAGQ